MSNEIQNKTINQKIYLSDKVVKDLTISEVGIAVYCYLKSIDRTDSSETYINPVAIHYFFTESFTMSDSQKKNIISGLKELAEHKLIDVITNNKYDYWCNISRLHFNNNNIEKEENITFFSIIELEEIRKIMRITEFDGKTYTASRYKMLRYYMVIISTFLKGDNYTVDIHDNKVSGVYGITAIDLLATMTGYSKGTIVQYNKIFEANKILWIYRANELILMDGEISGITNTYGRYRHMQYIETIGVRHKQMYGHTDESTTKKSNSKKARERRQLAAYYKNMIDNGKEYDKGTTIRVYRYIVERNTKEWNEDDISDLSIFDKYNYIQPIKEEIFKDDG